MYFILFFKAINYFENKRFLLLINLFKNTLF